MLLLCILGVGGCAIYDINHARYHEWAKAAATDQDLANDRFECMRTTPQSSWIGAGGLIQTRASEGRYFTACMEAKGWR